MQGRWWESYLVRYFSGFIIALIFSYFLLEKLIVFDAGLKESIFGQAIKKEAFGVGFLVWSIIPMALALCYISSAPITVLHAGRYRPGKIDSLSRSFWFAWLALGPVLFFLRNSLNSISGSSLVSLALVFMFFLVFCLREVIFNGKKFIHLFPDSWHFELVLKIFLLFSFLALIVGLVVYFVFEPVGSFEFTRSQTAWLYLALPSAWVLLGQYSVLYRLIRDESDFYKFYKKLSHERKKPESLDLRETYSHLREHSNAVFIVAVELSLFSLLILVFNTSEARLKASSIGVHVYQMFIFIIFCWILPTVFMWSVANRLERAMANGEMLDEMK